MVVLVQILGTGGFRICESAGESPCLEALSGSDVRSGPPGPGLSSQSLMALGARRWYAVLRASLE
eukprot:2117481-Rhodomonas_salina.2